MSPEVFSRMILLEEKSKILLDLMVFFDEGFEWKFEVGWKDEWDDIFLWKMLEVNSNLDSSKNNKSDEEQDTLFIDRNEVSKMLWEVSSGK